MNESLSMNRLWLLIRANVVSNHRKWLTTTAALAGLIFLNTLFSSDLNANVYETWFVIVLFLGGILFTSSIFGALHDKTRNEAYLMLPASSLEKTLASLLTVTVGFVIYLLTFLFLVSVLAESFRVLLEGYRGRYFNPLDRGVLGMIPVYLFAQSFYFLGAAWFRKMHAAKTTVTLIIGLIGFAIFASIVGQVLFASYIYDSVDFGLQFESVFDHYEVQIKQISALGETPIKWFIGLCSILPIITCWYIAWLRVSETQASDGV